MNKRCLYCGRFIKRLWWGGYGKKKYCNEGCAITLREKTREIYLKFRKANCEFCGECGKDTDPNKFLLVHHIDENQKNNSIENLVTMCRKCHYMIHSNSKDILFKKLAEKFEEN